MLLRFVWSRGVHGSQRTRGIGPNRMRMRVVAYVLYRPTTHTFAASLTLSVELQVYRPRGMKSIAMKTTAGVMFLVSVAGEWVCEAC